MSPRRSTTKRLAYAGLASGLALFTALIAWEGVREVARTLASAGIAGFKDMEVVIEERSPLGRNIEAADVGQAALYLCSPMAQMVTGTTLYVDSGYHAMGI